MQQAASSRAPTHLWIVGILAALWNGYACYEYLMTTMKNQAFMAKVPADQVAYMDSLPGWLTAFWAIGVWGGLLGAILLLMRSRYSVWAFALSLIGAIVGLGYQMFMTARPASMTGGAMAIIPWVIILVCLALFLYARAMEKKGVLR
jgi:hypothetical protein